MKSPGIRVIFTGRLAPFRFYFSAIGHKAISQVAVFEGSPIKKEFKSPLVRPYPR